MLIYDLAGCSWKLKGYYPWVPVKDRSMETGKELMGITDWIDATVPGGVHWDLYRADLIPYPYRDLDSLKCEWVENRWWLYRTTLSPLVLPKGDYYRLVFQGLDYHARVYVNGELVAEHEGMYEPVTVDITREVCSGKELELKVLLFSVPDEMGQIGMTSHTSTQKSRFGYKWDFGTRLVNLGIWESCQIQAHGEAELEGVSIQTDWVENQGIVRFSASVKHHDFKDQPLFAECVVTRGDQTYCGKVTVSAGQVSGVLEIENPALWYPNGHGEQPLYQVALCLCDGEGKSLDEYNCEVGIRHLSYCFNENSPKGALPYTFCMNRHKIYIKGVNMTPLDHIYGNVTEEHYEHMVKLMCNLNVNMVRVWGGGLIEKEVFYRLCDRYGILIWQEFIQSSSGIDNVPSKRPDFLHLLRRTALSAVRARRNHTALAVWSGGNELNDETGTPASYADANIAMLREIVEQNDPQRVFLPTSASGPREFISMDQGVSHDVHGNWNYEGNPKQYELFGSSDSLFHSEFGCEGMCSEQSLKRFVSPKYQTLAPVSENLVYRHHGELWDTFRRDMAIFGERTDLTRFVQCSQWMQAEGLRFILEANRRRKFCNSGSIIWQINEPWPNASCTSLVDYYLEPKMAYYWSKIAFADLAVSLNYSRLDYQPGSHFCATVHLSKDVPTGNNTYRVFCGAFRLTGEPLWKKELTGVMQEEKTVCVGEVSFALPEDFRGVFLLRLSAELDGMLSENDYFFGCGESKVYQDALVSTGAALQTKKTGEENSCLEYLVQSIGTVATLHIYPVCAEGFDLICDSAFFTLLPGEEKTVHISYSKKFSSGFLENSTVSECAPEIRFHYVNYSAED